MRDEWKSFGIETTPQVKYEIRDQNEKRIALIDSASHAKTIAAAPKMKRVLQEIADLEGEMLAERMRKLAKLALNALQ